MLASDNSLVKSKIEIIQWGFLLAALGLFTITEKFDSRVIAGLFFLVGYFVIRVVGGNFWPRNTGLEAPLALFVVSSGVATWISYDFSAALLRLARILAAVAFFSSISESTPVLQRWLAGGFLLATFALSVYWPMQHDFSASQAKFRIIDLAGQWINAHLPTFKLESITGPFIHPNVLAGTLALAIPFGVALVKDEWREHKKGLSVLAALLTVGVIFTLFLTGSRGTWVGLILAAGGLLLAWIQRRWFTSDRRKIGFWGLFTVVGLVVVGFLFARGDVSQIAGSLPGPAGTAQSRFDLWRQGWGLAQDYFFSGSGLGTFWMIHSIYSILIHVPFIAHTHNTFLEVWIEQGVLGAIALLWGSIVVFFWYWRALDRPKIPALAAAGLFGLASLAIHGMIDVVFYIERTLPLVGFALGYAWLAVPEKEPDNRKNNWSQSKTILIIGGSLLLFISIFIFRNGLISTLYSNLGAIAQTRLELSQYDSSRFQQLSIDQIRRSSDYSGIIENLDNSLAYDPTNKTSLQRLSELDLSRGEYAQAWELMQTAWDAGHRDLTSQLLYGDAAAANGEPEKAAAVLKGNPWAESRLMGLAWSRYWKQGDYQRALDTWKTVVILNPLNQDALKGISQAENMLNP